MRPRRVAAEYAALAEGKLLPAQGFNEAAASRRGIREKLKAFIDGLDASMRPRRVAAEYRALVYVC